MLKILKTTILIAALWGLPGPAAAQPAPIMRNCDGGDVACHVAADQIRREARAARAGSYAAMRNVAFCLETGCDSAVVPQPREACAWRKVVARKREADQGDRMNLNVCAAKGY